MNLPRTTHNWISVTGATIALIALFMIGFLLVNSVLWHEGSPYLGILIWMVLPGIMIFGLILIPVGMGITRRRWRREAPKEAPAWPKLDLNDKGHRNAFFIFSIGSATLLLLSAVGTYRAYHFTESVTFCAQVCHSLMTPEATARLQSPHAQVRCVQCHVGPGANWYVRSKLSGLHQVWAALTHTYPRPIPTPIGHLRPERIDCEQCHLPTEFRPNILRQNTYFLADSANTRWDLELEMKVSGGYPAAGLTSGSHWHVNPDIRITYAYADRQAQKIVRVEVEDKRAGTHRTYLSQDTTLTSAQIDSLPNRTVDCLTCHNRTTHRFEPPVRFVNRRMAEGAIPPVLPGIRKQAVKLFEKPYPSERAADRALSTTLRSYYGKTYPAVATADSAAVGQAVAALRDEYGKNFFPAMRVDWRVHPDNLGHLIDPGCFRCHGADLQDRQGSGIPRDCHLCHEILAQGPPGRLQAAAADSALDFHHPVDIGGAWQMVDCTACHTGTGAE